MHDVNNEDRNVAQTRASRSKIGERFVTRSIDDKQPRDLEVEGIIFVHRSSLHLDSIERKISCTDLLRDTSGFTFLDVGLTDLIEKLCLTSIDVTENTA